MTMPEPSADVNDLVVRAEAFAAQRQWACADELFLDAVARDWSPRSRIAYAVCLAEQERYFEAISHFTNILEGTDLRAIEIACHNLAAIYREVGDFDLARRFQWRSTLLQDDCGEEDLLGMANDALESEHSEVAASLVMTAQEIDGDEFNGCKDGDLIATTGLIKAALNSPEDALVTLFAAYRCHQAVADFRGMGTDLMNMALLFGEVNRSRPERSCLVRAIRCFEQASAPHSCQRARQQLRQLDQIQSVRSFDARRN